ncbi:Cytochrome P450 family protein [Sporothrix schenckii 1099-18]|uniref:Cytochrome P450 n=2 Tax=Sporothrix schenckii TaxID=29908 RepID=U7PW99_SPOS1|nr:Cytochrome P450 family protein [Sporothrix schenckii 1099-18]ERS99014.1 hypothetical protein HMPREF1624_04209 [Sporothrix schenckii ATCC 58251]KJR83335.1 Cytochrome P450 family protein [Sporothrix schenckii 1099-18]
MGLFTVQNALVVAGLFVVYLVGLGVYRLFFHPLAKVPGPRIAALTSWYCAYYDVYLGGQYIWKIKQLHEQYGPVLRIMPDVVHVNDPGFIDKLYTQSPKVRRERAPTVLNMFAKKFSMLPTKDHDVHRRRRAVLSRFFSHQSVRRLVPAINDTLAALLGRLQALAESGEPVRLSPYFKATTKDVIQSYAFGGGQLCLEMDDLNEPFFAVLTSGRLSHLAVHFHSLMGTMARLPPAILVKLQPSILAMIEFVDGLTEKIDAIRAQSPKAGDELSEKSSIFREVLDSDIDESDKRTERLVDEAMVLAIAGADTTAWSLAAICYHVLSNPTIFRRLRAELDSAMPDPTLPPDPVKLDGLRFLNALIEEVLRMHPSATHRQDRVAPDDDLVYVYDDGSSIVLPRGSSIGMAAPLLNRSPRLYRDPDTFDPDRFLEDPTLARRSMTFSRGARQCIGINLAYQELQTFTAGIFRKYSPYDPTQKVQNGPTMELYETTVADVELHSDYVAAHAYPGSKGVRVRIRD